MVLSSLLVALFGATLALGSSGPRVDRNLYIARQETDGLQNNVGDMLAM